MFRRYAVKSPLRFVEPSDRRLARHLLTPTAHRETVFASVSRTFCSSTLYTNSDSARVNGHCYSMRFCSTQRHSSTPSEHSDGRKAPPVANATPTNNDGAPHLLLTQPWPSAGASFFRNWRDTLRVGLLVLLGGLLYDTLLTNKDSIMLMLRECFVVTLEVRSSQDEFFVILEWLAQESSLADTSRNLMITEKGSAWRGVADDSSGSRDGAHDSSYSETDEVTGDDKKTEAEEGGREVTSTFKGKTAPWDITPGIGTHSIKYNARRFWISRRYDAEKGKGVNLSDTLPQVLTLSCFARNRSAMDALIRDIYLWHRNKMSEKVPVFIVDGSDWVSVGTKSRRELSSVFLPASTKQNFVKDIGTFLQSEPMYKALGLPWRRGYLFHGPPGTGKSSLIAAVASEYRLPVYLMSFKGEGGVGIGAAGGGGGPDLMWLTRLINSCQRPCILVMEDLDTSAIARSSHQEVTVAQDVERAESDQLVNSSGSNGAVSSLLNALDGLPSTDGKILIITANDPSRLPRALLRPGRVDDQIAFASMGPDERKSMAQHFARLASRAEAPLSEEKVNGERRKTLEVLSMASSSTQSPAEVQNQLLNELLFSRCRSVGN